MAAQINNQDMLALKGYIMAQDGHKYAQLHKDTCMIDITHSNLVQRHIELRFDKHEKIEELKFRIHRQTGTPPDYQKLLIKQGGQVIGEIGKDDSKMIGFYGIESGMEIHCVDLNPYSASANGGYEDVSKIQKYKMSDEEYEKRKGTLRDWAKKQKEKDANFTLEKHAAAHTAMVNANRHYKQTGEAPPGFSFIDGKLTADEVENIAPPGEDTVAGIEVGDRCEVSPGARRGTVMYVGEIEEVGAGHWVGVKFDEPVGMTNGTVKKSGKVVFDAGGDNMGGFCRGKNVKIGDFPERDLMDELEDSEDEL
ncbi:hypothetical protein TrLO_g6350 [Triparma laevis f. longispina]|uniref:CAP-Gly domain-containing protein n=1 Tax=Triparma laevis f. longispina TaxID=1714387 RepID=A0A9W7CBH6_9STRA|nr:hypothetical protein TrLO_g6350 [Triparma laevis f. longispina]